MELRPYIKEIDVFDFKKRYVPEKYYVYCIKIYWSNNLKQFIYRRYSQFHVLKVELTKKFISESGSHPGRPEDRTIPLLPGKILFRSQTKSVASERIKEINKYCKKLISLSNDISKSDLVLNFFKITDDDSKMHTDPSVWIKPDKSENLKGGKFKCEHISSPLKMEDYLVIKSYKAKTDSEISVTKGSKVNVIEKNFNGWWLIDTKDGQGFLPQCYLEKKCAFEQVILEKAELHMVISDYKAQKPDELSVKKNEDFVEVLKKCQSGFWLVRMFGGCEGLVPAVVLTKVACPSIDNMTLINSFKLKTEENSSKEVKENNFDVQALTENDDSNKSDEEILNSSTDSFNKPTPTEEHKLLFNKNVPQPKRPAPKCEIKYDEDIVFSVSKYNDQVGDGISFDKGQRLSVLKRDKSNGWWYVQNVDNLEEGWAPSILLEPQVKTELFEDKSPAMKQAETATIKSDNILLNAVSSQNSSNEYKTNSNHKLIFAPKPPLDSNDSESTLNYDVVEKVKDSNFKRITSQKKVNWEEPNENNSNKSPSRKLKTNESMRSVLKSSTNRHASQTVPQIVTIIKETPIDEVVKPQKEFQKIMYEQRSDRKNNDDFEIEYDSDTIKLHAELKKITLNLKKNYGIDLNAPLSAKTNTTPAVSELVSQIEPVSSTNSVINNVSIKNVSVDESTPATNITSNNNGLRILKKLKKLKN